MFHHYGVYHLGRKLVACRADYCTNCLRPTFTEGFRSFAILHVWFIPILPLGFRIRWVCSDCHRDPERQRPDNMGIVVAGALAGALMIFISIMVSLESNNLEAWPLTLFGAALLSVCLYLLHSSRRTRYAAGKSGVTPLPTDACPYCREPILPGAKPACQACGISICAID